MQKVAFLSPGFTAASTALLPAHAHQPIGSTREVRAKAVISTSAGGEVLPTSTSAGGEVLPTLFLQTDVWTTRWGMKHSALFT